MLEKNSLEFGLAMSHGGFPSIASKPEPAARNTSGNSSSQWKKRFSAAMRSARARVVGRGVANVVGSGAWSRSSAGQNQQAHHRSIASLSATVGRRAQQLVAIEAGALGAVVHGQFVQARERGERVVVDALRPAAAGRADRRATLSGEEAAQVGRERVLDERLDRLGRAPPSRSARRCCGSCRRPRGSSRPSPGSAGTGRTRRRPASCRTSPCGRGTRTGSVRSMVSIQSASRHSSTASGSRSTP